MINDPIVAEIRTIRDQNAAKFNNDIDAIFRDLMEKQMSSGRTYVKYPPRPVVGKAVVVEDVEPTKLADPSS